MLFKKSAYRWCSVNRILLIDDDDLILKSVENLLKNQGYQVVLATDGYEALERVKTLDFDLIICDMRMPGMNGIETVQNIRQELRRNGKKNIAEIFLTGYAEQDLVKQARQMKVKGYIYKPFDLKEFLMTIRRALENG